MSIKWPLPTLCFLLLAKALLIVCFILYSGIGLGPDEAQYWTWSRKLAWGYYSKPPGIAWQIWAGTELFGPTELGVRFGSLVLGTLLPLLIYFLGKEAELDSKTAFYAAIGFALTPLGFLASFFAITDVGNAFFWTAALFPLVTALRDKRPINFILLGILIGCGALFKWQIYWLWAVVLVLLAFFPHLRHRQILLGLAVSLLGLLPSFIWNYSHDFATFRHVFSTLNGDDVAGVVNRGNALDFIAAQAGLLSPLLFVLWMASIWALFKEKSEALKFLGWTGLTILFAHIALAVFKKMQGNWCDYIYPGVLVWLAWYAKKGIRKTLFLAGVALALLSTLVLFFIPQLEKTHLFFVKANPFKHNIGWEGLSKNLLEAGYREDNFLFGPTYQITSLLSFYNPTPPPR